MPIKNKILNFKNLKKVRDKFKTKKIVLCHGVFDLLHVGHINYFKSAKKSKKPRLVLEITILYF